MASMGLASSWWTIRSFVVFRFAWLLLSNTSSAFLQTRNPHTLLVSRSINIRDRMINRATVLHPLRMNLHTRDDPEQERDTPSSTSMDGSSRRRFLSHTPTAAASLSAALFWTGMGSSLSALVVPQMAQAETTTSVTTTAEQEGNGASSSEGLVTAEELAARLRVVPTFCIVDPKGVPYMVFGEDAKVTGYFFTSYGEAARILKVARESADRAREETAKEIRAKRRTGNTDDPEQRPLTPKEIAYEIGFNPWRNARISTVPLDLAVTLCIKSTNTKSGGIHFQVAPTEDDISDALALDKSGRSDLPEGKVPLFYVEELKLEATGSMPVYFHKSELLAEWNRQQKGKKNNKPEGIPKIQVSELFTLITAMVKPATDKVDPDLSKIVFLPPVESAQRAKECLKASGKEPPFKLGERIVVL
uniref:Uncharacterized protein n=1 Tax=Attheya septentrionalis TaxID=420275 RepID=A0A7S2UG07_9STRA|mmetsp:Transcript_24386/g.44101  ORF Transcript_24386/g.44101 Transcript_24386/m.44101 type:complete len:418 (+) Transcript_24386:67-1320(+)